jgi:hypothetical protein
MMLEVLTTMAFVAALYILKRSLLAELNWQGGIEGVDGCQLRKMEVD